MLKHNNSSKKKKKKEEEEERNKGLSVAASRTLPSAWLARDSVQPAGLRLGPFFSN